MSLVDVHNEWDPMREVIIGRIDGAKIPSPGRDLYAVEFHDLDSMNRIPSGAFPKQVIEETTEDLQVLCSTLESMGIVVRRPDPFSKDALIETGDWKTDGFYDYCPRDVLLAVGNTIIETPMALRSRFLEPFAYKRLLLEYFQSGAKWLSAPKPRLLDNLYVPEAEAGARLANTEPVFDAANILRFGTDILYLVSDSGNEMGARWLQQTLGPDYTVEACFNLYASTHVDSTIVPIRPGLVLLNPSRVNDANMPSFLKGWDKIWCPEPRDIGFLGENPYCSVWIGMNLLVVSPGVVIVDDRQVELIKMLNESGVETIPLRLTHSRTLGGSFHCVSLDVRREGKLESYS